MSVDVDLKFTKTTIYRRVIKPMAAGYTYDARRPAPGGLGTRAANLLIGSGR